MRTLIGIGGLLCASVSVAQIDPSLLRNSATPDSSAMAPADSLKEFA